MSTSITTLFLDIGGVLLTNGWDRALRKRTAEKFGVDYAEMDSRHHLTYDTYEVGKMSFEEYLKRVVFYEPRSFSNDEVVSWILNEAKPYDDMIDLVKKLRKIYNLRIAVVSNEGRELAVDRIARFKLDEFVDFFIVSSFVHFRKPDIDIWKVAIDVSQAQPENVAYIDDRPMFVEVGQSLGLHGIHNTDAASTRLALEKLGLTL